MKFEKTRVMNFEGAFRGMRNPKNSWHKSDSFFGLVDGYDETDFEIAAEWAESEKPEYYGEHYGEPEIEDKRIKLEDQYDDWLMKTGILQEGENPNVIDVAFIGPEDMQLAQQLIKAGPEHRKFMRQILISVDITAPIYWWKEASTYKVGTVANSTSTMHKLTSKPITLDCFEIDDYVDSLNWTGVPMGDCVNCYDSKKTIFHLIDVLEGLRLKYLETKDTRYWKELIRWLPESWLQTRTWTANYEILRNIYHQRKNHKLSEWHSFCKWIESLPYANELILFDNKA